MTPKAAGITVHFLFFLFWECEHFWKLQRFATSNQSSLQRSKVLAIETQSSQHKPYVPYKILKFPTSIQSIYPTRMRRIRSSLQLCTSTKSSLQRLKFPTNTQFPTKTLSSLQVPRVPYKNMKFLTWTIGFPPRTWKLPTSTQISIHKSDVLY